MNSRFGQGESMQCMLLRDMIQDRSVWSDKKWADHIGCDFEEIQEMARHVKATYKIKIVQKRKPEYINGKFTRGYMVQVWSNDLERPIAGPNKTYPSESEAKLRSRVFVQHIEMPDPDGEFPPRFLQLLGYTKQRATKQKAK